MWKGVTQYASELSSDCCMVEGGIGRYNGENYHIYIGKGFIEESTFIGRTYLESYWRGLYVMDGAIPKNIEIDFEVLTYDCKNTSVKLLSIEN